MLAQRTAHPVPGGPAATIYLTARYIMHGAACAGALVALGAAAAVLVGHPFEQALTPLAQLGAALFGLAILAMSVMLLLLAETAPPQPADPQELISEAQRFIRDNRPTGTHTPGDVDPPRVRRRPHPHRAGAGAVVELTAVPERETSQPRSAACHPSR